MKKKITLIAEIGENYLGDIKLAKKLVSEAKKNGADYAKFQSYNEMCLKVVPNIIGLKVSLSDQNHINLKILAKKD